MTCRVFIRPSARRRACPLEDRAVRAWWMAKSARAAGGQAALDDADRRTASVVDIGLQRIAADEHPHIRRIADGFTPGPPEPEAA